MSKKIGIDMRMAGEGYGIGKYIGELVSSMLKLNDGRFKFVLYFDKHRNKAFAERLAALGAAAHFVGPSYYSVAEQVILPIEFLRNRVDLMHFPNFNVPVLYPKKFVLTIHDLIHHKYPGTKRRNAVYRWGYRTVIRSAAKRAEKIIAVSNSVKQDISKTFNIRQDKIETVYEGVSGSFFENPQSNDSDRLREMGIKKPYILWVGVWRRYKNLSVLAQAYSNIRSVFNGSLVLAGNRDEHHPEVYDTIINTPGLIAPGQVSEDVLKLLYRNAECFVLPSLVEGFGLTLIEAQASGTPVVASDIPVCREVAGGSAIYFDATSAEALSASLMKILHDSAARSNYKVLGAKNAKRYTWEQTARATMKIYQDVLN